MPSYRVDAHGATFRVNSPVPLTDEQVWAAVQPEADAHRATQVAQEEAGKAKGGEYKIGKEGFKQAAQQVADETGVAGNMLQGGGETLNRYAMGLKKLVTGLTPEDTQNLEERRTMAEAGGGAALAGQMIGDAALTYPLMRAPGLIATAPKVAPVLAKVLPQALTATRTGRIGMGAAEAIAPNALAGALGSPEDMQKGAAWGAAGGALGAGANRLIGGALKPAVSGAGRELIEQGIQPTPGQALGGWAGKMEEKAGSLPLVGDIIGRARNRSLKEYNEAIAGRISQEVTGDKGLPRAAGRALGKAGDEELTALRRQIGDVYEQVLARTPNLRVERDLVERKLADIASDPGLGLSDASAKRLFDYAEKHLLARGADISGDIAKRLESDMGRVASNMKSSSTAEERAYGEAIDRLHQFWREGLKGSLAPTDRELLGKADAAWRAFRPVDEAAKTATSQLRPGAPGVYTPRVLRSSLAAADKSQSDNVLRAMQAQPVSAAKTPHEYVASMSRAGQTLGDVVPSSGTAERLLATAGLGGGALATDFATTLGAASASALATGAAYSRMGAMLMTQGAFPATREAAAKFLASKGVPPEMIPTLTQQTLAAYERTKHKLPLTMGAK